MFHNLRVCSANDNKDILVLLLSLYMFMKSKEIFMTDYKCLLPKAGKLAEPDFRNLISVILPPYKVRQNSSLFNKKKKKKKKRFCSDFCLQFLKEKCFISFLPTNAARKKKVFSANSHLMMSDSMMRAGEV